MLLPAGLPSCRREEAITLVVRPLPCEIKNGWFGRPGRKGLARSAEGFDCPWRPAYDRRRPVAMPQLCPKAPPDVWSHTRMVRRFIGEAGPRGAPHF
jgi:hypothetical protein